jgi:PAS domain S-box-containing protein
MTEGTENASRHARHDDGLEALRGLVQRLVVSSEGHDPLSATLDAIADAIGVERACYVWVDPDTRGSDPPEYALRCSARAAEHGALPARLCSESVRRWVAAVGSEGILHGSAEDLPAERAVLERLGATLLAVVPVFEGGRAQGLLVCADGTPHRTWSGVELEALRGATQIPGASMENQRRLSALRASEHRLKEAQAIAHIGHFERDILRGLDTWSDETFRIYGLEPGSIEPSVDEFLRRVHPEDRARVANEIDAALRRSSANSIDHRIVRPDGTTRYVRTHARVLEDGAGRPVRVIGTHQDVTEHVHTQEALGRVSEQLRHITERVPAIVFRRIVHPDGRVEYPFSAGSLYARLGLDAEGMAKDPTALLDHIHPDDVAPFRARIRDRSKSTGRHEFRVVTPEKQVRWLRTSFSARTGEDGTFVAEGVVLDVTEEKGLEDQLRQAQKLEAVGSLTGGIAHDFNNLLSVILVNARLIRSAVEEGRTPLDELEDLEEAARSGADLVKGLLGFSRRAELVLQPIDLADSVVHMAHLLKRLVPETIDFHMAASVGAGVAHADLAAVQQILMNLVTNARDAMPDGGRLLLDVGSDDFTGTHPDTGEKILARPYATIVVQDTGVGIPPETLRRVFEPFFSTKEPGKGSGLGMGVVHGLVRQHGGFVQIASEPGRGTRVKVYLPMSRSEPNESAQATPSPDLEVGGGDLVLLVEDQEALRRTTERTLDRLGYRVVAAGDGVEALALFRTHPEPFDLVLTDVVMPKMGGVELCEEIRRISPDARFLFVSGYSDTETQGRRFPEGARFAPKPWTLEELSRAVRETIDGVAVARLPAT